MHIHPKEKKEGSAKRLKAKKNAAGVHHQTPRDCWKAWSYDFELWIRHCRDRCSSPCGDTLVQSSIFRPIWGLHTFAVKSKKSSQKLPIIQLDYTTRDCWKAYTKLEIRIRHCPNRYATPFGDTYMNLQASLGASYLGGQLVRHGPCLLQCGQQLVLARHRNQQSPFAADSTASETVDDGRRERSEILVFGVNYKKVRNED